MRMKILSLFAAASLVSACATEPEDSGSAKSEGSSTQASSSSAKTATAPKTASKVKKATPSGAPPGSRVDFFVNVGDRIFFDLDKSEITEEAAGTLKKQSAWLQKYKNHTVFIRINW